jgi:hypothetical protein
MAQCSDVDVLRRFAHGAINDFGGGGDASCFTLAVQRDVD